MFAVKFDVEGADAALARFAELERRCSPAGIRVWFRSEAHPILRDRAADRFANEGDDAAGRWADLRAATGLIRHSQGFPAFHPINVRSGRLKWFTLLTYKIQSSSASSSLFMPGNAPDRNTLSKLRVAQMGGMPPKGRRTRRAGPSKPAPPRPVVAISGTDERLLNASLHAFLLRKGTTPP